MPGPRNAGRPLLLEGGLDWRAMSLSPRDMDFIALKQMAAREIALALGVPPLLPGLPGDNTYTNYQEANRTFWRQTVIPLAMRLARALSGWLLTTDDGRLQLRCNLDDLVALSADREALWARLDGANFLTVDEKRAAAGYGPMAEAVGGPAPKFNPHHDEAGRFTFAPSGSGNGADPPDQVTTPLPRIGDPAPPRPTPVAGRPRGPVGPPKPPAPPTAPAKPTDAQPQFKNPKSGLTGKEGSKDIPSWAQGERPLTNENGEAYAKRFLDRKYGAGQYKEGPTSEFNQLKKYGDRNFD
jgi:Phage portal protein